jgi:hypothetical protein
MLKGAWRVFMALGIIGSILTHLGYDFYIKSHYIDIVECGLIDGQVYHYGYPLAA